ncbi:STAS-like domain-containing protein [Sphaerospermopsis sp. FACHB-1194]|nr:STAS-like domain-containing protein [Sphaerospermopsis sp. FACHB-1194]
MNKASLTNKLDWNYLNLKKRVSENNPNNLFLFKRGILPPSNSKVKVFTKYEVFDLVGKTCITVNDGQKIYDLVHRQLQANQPVELDFAGVEVFAAPFFNFAIGQLLKDIQPENLSKLLKINNIKPLGNQIISLVIENSKRYYSDPIFRSRLDQVINEKSDFTTLVEEWREETRGVSSTNQMCMHPAYQQIIGMGEPVIPLLLRELEKKSGRWFWALKSISREDPVPPEYRGNTKEMTKAWLDWGRERGYKW